jgi:hypothetical protein
MGLIENFEERIATANADKDTYVPHSNIGLNFRIESDLAERTYKCAPTVYPYQYVLK